MELTNVGPFWVKRASEEALKNFDIETEKFVQEFVIELQNGTRPRFYLFGDQIPDNLTEEQVRSKGGYGDYIDSIRRDRASYKCTIERLLSMSLQAIKLNAFMSLSENELDLIKDYF